MTTAYEQLKAMGKACIDNTPQQVESLAISANFWDGKGHPEFKQIVADSKGALYEYYGLNSGCLVGKPWNEHGIIAHNKEYVAVVNGGCFKPESPQEKAKRERDVSIEEMMSLVSTGSIHDDYDVKWAIEKLYDAGYRKGE